MAERDMEKIVSLARRRGFMFQSSEIYGGLNGFWDYGPLGVELKRNVKEAWWEDMNSRHDDLAALPGAPGPYEMTGLDATIIMHPQVWKCSGHFDLFCDMMVDCRETKKRYRFDQIAGRWVTGPARKSADAAPHPAAEAAGQETIFVTSMAEEPRGDIETRALKYFQLRAKDAAKLEWKSELIACPDFHRHAPAASLVASEVDFGKVLAPDTQTLGTLTEPREFNLMFKTIVGAMGNEADAAFLRPETAQGIFVNFKNILDSTRIRVPFGVAQIGKSFRNEITPRHFTFRSREFEQMEIEFFCHPQESHQWYKYWRDRRFQWYLDLGLSEGRLQLRDHSSDELSHYSTGTADIEYAFPFLDEGEFGELEGIAHRGDFDLRSHMEGKLDPASKPLTLQLDSEGKPVHRGSGRDLTYRDDLSGERYTPHVVEPSAGADRATLAFLCEAYTEDEAPDDKGQMQTRTVMKFHPRLAPLKAAILPLVKKDGMPEVARDLTRTLKQKFPVFYDEKGAIGRRYRRQDEVGTPFCITVDGQTMTDQTVTLRDRDSLEQIRLKLDEVVSYVEARVR